MTKSIRAILNSVEPRIRVQRPTRPKFAGNPVVCGVTLSLHYCRRRAGPFRTGSTDIAIFTALSHTDIERDGHVKKLLYLDVHFYNPYQYIWNLLLQQ